MRKQPLLLFVLLLLGGTCIKAQSGGQSVGTIYSDNNISVELYYKVNPELCNTNSKESKYWYVLKGKSIGSDLFLNWKMDYYSCNGQIMCQTNYLNIGKQENIGTVIQMDWTFQGYKVAREFYDVKTASSADLTTPYSIGTITSAPANGIKSDKQVFPGETLSLTVIGGQLGIGAEWVWYKDSCQGTFVGKGVSVLDKPKQSTTYFVRAESAKDTTACVSTFVKVSENSIAADGVTGKKIICKGDENIKISVVGGKLGIGAEWVWYKNDCLGNRIGVGRAIEVSPKTNTSYYVRAESSKDTSECRNIDITITDSTTSPVSVKSNSSTVCTGDMVTLNVVGGKLAPGANWIWYSDFVSSSNKVADGEFVNLRPRSTTTYKVRGEGICNNTELQSITITVNKPTILPSGINGLSQNSYRKNSKVNLSVNGGQLSNNGTWVWYSGDTKIGTGETISHKTKKNSTIKVRAENGTCEDKSAFVEKSYSVYRKPHNTYINIGLASSNPLGNSEIEMPGSSPNLVVTYAKNNLRSTFGWYLKGKACISTPSSDLKSDNSGIIEGYSNPGGSYSFNAKATEARTGATIGFLFGPKRVRLFIGAGYGKRNLYWNINETTYNASTMQADVTSKWVQNKESSYEGLEVEAGLVIKISRINIIAGVSSIANGNAFASDFKLGTESFKYADMHVGIGFNF
jgi:hypothetical protein